MRALCAIQDDLHIDTLESLEIAAHDGRLETVKGIGARRAASIRASLASMLALRRRRGADDHGEPPVGLLLEVEALYRLRARSGDLQRVAPRRFNPTGEAWLPVMHL